MDNTENTLIDAQASTDAAAEPTTTEASATDAGTVTDTTIVYSPVTEAIHGLATNETTTGAHAGIPTSELGMPLAADPITPPVLVIAPSVGRKVHFYPGDVQFHSKPHCINPAVPMDATVVFVWSDRMVNLHVVDHIGQVHALTSITLRQPDDVIAEGAAYAEWMPFQVGQARNSI